MRAQNNNEIHRESEEREEGKRGKEGDGGGRKREGEEREQQILRDLICLELSNLQ